MAKVAEIKTKQNEASVEDFLKTITDEQKRKDCETIIKMMKKATKEEPKMWGSSMIGFGKLRYKSPASGREVDWFNIGFAPRKANISLHLTMALNKHSALLKKLGKHKTGAGCVYINKLEDVDKKVLEEMIKEAVKK